MKNFMDYEISEELHNSNNSIVYRVIHNITQNKFILKLFKEKFPTTQQLINYKHEFEITNKANIEGVIKSYNLLKHRENHLIIFEEFEAISLNKLYRNKRPDLITFLNIAIKITDILGNIHKKNIIHKDINPSNIVFNIEKNELKIIDFGLSIKLFQENISVNPLNLLEGTLAYMSPEQTGRMNRCLDYRTDFYSLGLTLYELLTGEKLFNSQEPLEMVHFHMAREPVFVENNIPDMIIKIIRKLIAKTAEDRYQSAWGVKYDLEKCLNSIQKKVAIKEFCLGKSDIPDKLCISQKLYGREADVNTLFNTFEKVSKSNMEFLLVGGYSGIGKTSLIQEVYKFNQQRTNQSEEFEYIPYICKGKFEQFLHHIPFSAISQACSSLIKQILKEPKAEVEQWKDCFIKTMGANAQIITILAPEFEILIGKQSPLKQLNSVESLNRLQFSFANFIKVFSQKKIPVIMFLDDLQWADTASLNLLKSLYWNKEINYFLFIGAFRNNEINEKHSLMLWLSEIEKYKPVTKISLKNLNEKNVNQIISDTIKKSPEDINSLAKVIFAKTDGNPFFVSELLKSIYDKQILSFNFSNYNWEWEQQKLENLAVSENVVFLILEKLKKCSDQAIELLKTISCVGNTFNLKTLLIITNNSLEFLAPALLEIVKIGAIIPLGNAYKELQFLTNESLNKQLLNSEYKFHHDKVQKAAYLLNEKAELEQRHYSIATFMLKNFSQIEIELKIIDIVQHFNKGRSLFKSKAERVNLGLLNLKAGKKAKLASAYQQALEYFTEGKNILPESAWITDYDLAFDLFISFSECAYICREFEIAETGTEFLISKARTKLEKAEIYYLQTVQYTTMQKLEKALETVKKGLLLLGLELPDDYPDSLIIYEAQSVNNYLGQRVIEKLIDEPEITDLETRLIIRLFQGIFLPAYSLGKKNLLAFCILKAVNICLKYGNIPESAYIFNSYALLQGHIFGDLKTAFKFGNLSLAIMERFKDDKSTAVNLFTNTTFVQYWNKPPSKYVESYKQVIATGLETGDLIYTSYACTNVIQWDNSFNLSQAIFEAEKYLKIIKIINFQDSIDVAYIFQNLRLNLVGKTEGIFSFTTEDFSEITTLERLKRTKNFLVLAIYHIYKIQPYFYYENYEMALHHISQAEKMIDALAGQAHIVDFTIFAFLTYSALYQEALLIEKEKIWQKLEEYLKKMIIWSDNMPDNFIHLRYLMDAELAMLKGNVLESDTLYNKSINASRKNSYIQYEAIANEQAAKLWLNNDREEFAKLYLKKSCYAYQIWGASRKVEQLLKKYEAIEIFESETTNKLGVITTTSKLSFLDIETVIKSSQTLLNERNLATLLEKMMKLILENSGAENGLLLLPQKDKWFIEAEYNINSDKINVLQSFNIEDNLNGKKLANSVLYYAIHSGENVVINNVPEDKTFSNDIYINEMKPLSILCMPLINQGNIQGVLYLENSLMTEVFTEQRLEILTLLLSQAAISIKNTIIYKELEHMVQERTEDLLKANVELKELNFEKNELLELVTHNLRSPLGGIIGFASSINSIRDLTPAETELYSAQILSNGKRMLRMIKDLLDINTIEAGKYKIHKENIDIASFIEDLLFNYSEQLREKHLTINFKNTKSSFILFIDEQWLSQILDNLISNAIKFSPPGKKITISLISQDNKKQITITDEGPGLTDNDHNNLFQKFSRLTAQPTNGEISSGLGLSIVKKMVDIMDGQVFCESKAGKGASFIIEF